LNSSWEAHKRRVCAYYEDLLHKHGPTVQVADASTNANQQARYRVLTETLDLDGSVLDVGCGLGWFANFEWGYTKYLGIDLSERIIGVARELNPNMAGSTHWYPEIKFEVIDIMTDPVEPHDVVIGNGIFYILQDEPYKYMFAMIRKMYAIANEAVAFNCLNEMRGHIDGEFWARPDVVLAFCMELCPKVVLRADYLPQDFTVFLYK